MQYIENLRSDRSGTLSWILTVGKDFIQMKGTLSSSETELSFGRLLSPEGSLRGQNSYGVDNCVLDINSWKKSSLY